METGTKWTQKIIVQNANIRRTFPLLRSIFSLLATFFIMTYTCGWGWTKTNCLYVEKMKKICLVFGCEILSPLRQNTENIAGRCSCTVRVRFQSSNFQTAEKNIPGNMYSHLSHFKTLFVTVFPFFVKKKSNSQLNLTLDSTITVAKWQKNTSARLADCQMYTQL